MNYNNLKISNLQLIILYIIFYISLIFGFYYNENLTGGAIRDFNSYIQMLNLSSNDLSNFLDNFMSHDMDHSPFFFSFLGIFQNIFDNVTFSVNEIDTKYDISYVREYIDEYNFLRLIYLHVSCLIPFVFYICLKEKYPSLKKNFLYFISLFIFISPCFRSYSIWLGDLNLSLLFILLGVYFFLKLEKEKVFSKQLLFITLNVLFVAIASYIRPIYSLFSIYFFYSIFLKFNFSYHLMLFSIVNLILAFPAIYYVFVMDNVFFTVFNNFFIEPTLNLYSTNILIISTLFLFYLIPILILKRQYIASYFINSSMKNNIIFFSSSFLIIFFLIFNFNYPNIMGGGGVFYKTSKLIFNNNYFFYLVCFLSFLIFSKIIFDRNVSDILLLIILICLDPDPFVYHKTYDPLLICVTLLLFKNELFQVFNKNIYKKFSIYLILYYFLILIMFMLARTFIN